LKIKEKKILRKIFISFNFSLEKGGFSSQKKNCLKKLNSEGKRNV